MRGGLAVADGNGVSMRHQRWTQCDITTLRNHLGAGDMLVDAWRDLERSP